jgi:lysozyme family protein
MTSLNRRQALVSAASGLALTTTSPQRATSQAMPAPAPASRSREVQDLFAQAERTGVAGPRAAGAPSLLDLAELVDGALARGEGNEEAATIAARAGLLLAELSRDERDGLATDEVAPAAPRTLTPAIEQEYRDLLASARIRDAARPELVRVARFVTSARAKERYKAVEADTHVPWFVVGAIHYREANLNFLGHLHNGDPLLFRTVHVPERRPPPPWPKPDVSPAELWRDSARDALRRFATPGDWTMPKICFLLEAYNGFGCRDNNIHSPYLWNYTQHYSRGGFPRDHVFSPDYVSRQAGLMAAIVAMKESDPDVVLNP